MAKGLRASVKKSNRQKLRSNVFAPVEDARTQRLHEKLLETIRQAKPEPPQKQDMDVDSNHGNAAHTQPLTSPPSTNFLTTEANPENEYPKGSLFSATRIPQTLLSVSCEEVYENSEDSDACETPTADDDGAMACELLWHCLGLSSDVVGFTEDGKLQLAFGPPQY